MYIRIVIEGGAPDIVVEWPQWPGKLVRTFKLLLQSKRKTALG